MTRTTRTTTRKDDSSAMGHQNGPESGLATPLPEVDNLFAGSASRRMVHTSPQARERTSTKTGLRRRRARNTCKSCRAKKVKCIRDGQSNDRHGTCQRMIYPYSPQHMVHCTKHIAGCSLKGLACTYEEQCLDACSRCT